MKNVFACVLLLAVMQPAPPAPEKPILNNLAPAQNVFLITLDGFRWQELFTGADPSLISDEKYTPDTATMKALYWAPDAEGRRKKLLPFFWSVVASKGQIHGNRIYKNRVNTANLYAISYPGYSEMLTGNADLRIHSNHAIHNPNQNVLEYLDGTEKFKGDVVAFTSWSLFPFILNQQRNGMRINSGYQPLESLTERSDLIDILQSQKGTEKSGTRHDDLTFLAAMEYISEHKPRVVFLGFGETDEAAHDGRYDLYLEKAAEADRMIAKLWHWVQTTGGYKNNTTFIITTDHGRGNTKKNWSNHGTFVSGSSQTWLALLGPAIEPLGESTDEAQLYQKQIASAIAGSVGMQFPPANPGD